VIRFLCVWFAMAWVPFALVACGGGGAASSPASPVLLSIAVSGGSNGVKQGQAVQLSALATYSDGTSKDVSSGANWASADNAVISVSSTGLATGMAAGTSNVSATLAGVSRSVAITVTAICSFTGVTDGIVVSNATQLRAALSAAGGNGKDDAIYINGGLYIADTPFIYDAKGSTEKISLIGCDKDDVVFDGRSTSRIFHFQKNGPIKDYQSGAVDIYHSPFPSLLVRNVTLKNGSDASDSNLYGRNGGGMLIERYTTEMDHVIFSGNFGQYWGGGFSGAGDLIISSSRFTGNTALQSGSAFESCGSINIYDTVFEQGNASLYYAGAAVSRTTCIEADYATKPVSIYRSTFQGNGTALAIIGGYGLENSLLLGEVLIEDSLFQDNVRRALYLVDAGNLNVRRSRFLRNGPRKNEDALSFTWNDCINQIQDCVGGGAVMIVSGIGTLRFENSEFVENRAPNYGGAIFHLGGSCEQYITPCVPPVLARAAQASLILVNNIFKGNQSHRGAAVSIGRQPGSKGFQYGNSLIVGGSFFDNVATSLVPSSGRTPIDGLTTSIIYVGGELNICGQPILTGNLAEKEIIALGGKFSNNCPASP